MKTKEEEEQGHLRSRGEERKGEKREYVVVVVYLF